MKNLKTKGTVLRQKKFRIVRILPADDATLIGAVKFLHENIKSHFAGVEVTIKRGVPYFCPDEADRSFVVYINPTSGRDMFEREKFVLSVIETFGFKLVQSPGHTPPTRADISVAA